jgi:hypothetical protein
VAGTADKVEDEGHLLARGQLRCRCLYRRVDGFVPVLVGIFSPARAERVAAFAGHRCVGGWVIARGWVGVWKWKCFGRRMMFYSYRRSGSLVRRSAKVKAWHRAPGNADHEVQTKGPHHNNRGAVDTRRRSSRKLHGISTLGTISLVLYMPGWGSWQHKPGA